MNRIIRYVIRLFISSIKVFYLKLRGAQIGSRVLLGRVTFKTSPKNIRIGDGVVIEDGVVFDQLKTIEIKDFVKIHKDVHIENGTGGNASFSISYNSWVGSETIINCERDITIESNVGIGCRSQFWTHGYFPSTADGFPSKLDTITIREGVWLPPSCIILPGVEVGEYSIIGTGSVITKDIPDRVFATGVPCKVKAEENAYRKTLTPQEKIEAVLKGCIDNLQLQGGTASQIDGSTWECSFYFKKFTITFQENPEIWTKPGNACIFTWEKPQNTGHFAKNISLFVLSDNSYTKRSTLHEWIVIRALLDSCTLRLKPIASA